MGSWFSNIHIRKSETATTESAAACVKDLMASKGYQLAASKGEADGAVALVSEGDSQWISVYSDLITHDDPESCAAIASPISEKLHTDVLGISCFDSDYLYLNLINVDEKTNAWIGIGKGRELGIARRNNVAAWKKRVSDYSGFSAKAKIQYILADEFLYSASQHLGLPAERSAAVLTDWTNSGSNARVVYLYFSRPEEDRERVEFAHYSSSLPCLVGRESHLIAINIGAQSQGMSVYFLGPYVEHEEITFENVFIRHQGTCTPVELTKVQFPDGQWAYCYHDPQIVIPPKVAGRMSKEKRYSLERMRWFAVYFTPRGNSRKTLDISVAFVPDEKTEGYTVWNVWKPRGSKKAFIEYHNKIWKQVRAVEGNSDSCLPLLREEDFD